MRDLVRLDPRNIQEIREFLDKEQKGLGYYWSRNLLNHVDALEGKLKMTLGATHHPDDIELLKEATSIIAASINRSASQERDEIALNWLEKAKGKGSFRAG